MQFPRFGTDRALSLEKNSPSCRFIWVWPLFPACGSSAVPMKTWWKPLQYFPVELSSFPVTRSWTELWAHEQHFISQCELMSKKSPPLSALGTWDSGKSVLFSASRFPCHYENWTPQKQVATGELKKRGRWSKTHTAWQGDSSQPENSRNLCQKPTVWGNTFGRASLSDQMVSPFEPPSLKEISYKTFQRVF